MRQKKRAAKKGSTRKRGGRADGPEMLPPFLKWMMDEYWILIRGDFCCVWLGQRAEGGDGAEEGAEGKDEAPPELTREGSSENR